MRINFVTQWFPPEPGTSVAETIADGLARRGHEINVLTGFPNYPTGRIQPGYRQRPYLRESRADGVVVHRAPLFPSHDRSAFRRAGNYISFAVSASLTSRARLGVPDAWLTYSSPATALLPSLLARRARRTPSYMIVQDLWPDSVLDAEMLSGVGVTLARHALERYCSWTYHRVAGIGVISSGMREVLESRGVAADKIHYTPNSVPSRRSRLERVTSADLRRMLGIPTDRRAFLYAGNMGRIQNLEPLIEGFAQVPRALLLFLGDGIARADLEDLVAGRRLPNVRFVDPVSTDVAADYIAACDVQIVSLKDSPLLRVTMPSKVQHAMEAGKPILAHAAGDVATLVAQAGCGAIAQPGAMARLVAAIDELTRLSASELDAMGRNARRAYDHQFSEQSALDRLETMLRSHTSQEGKTH